MVEKSVLDVINEYLRAINETGIHAHQAILFGSWARNQAGPDSDIDLVVIAPEFDSKQRRKFVNRLWELTATVPEAWRIEPIACGERQWLEDDGSPIIAIARQEGYPITFTPETA
jgi:predicted nucleotidyltransferase